MAEDAMEVDGRRERRERAREPSQRGLQARVLVDYARTDCSDSRIIAKDIGESAHVKGSDPSVGVDEEDDRSTTRSPTDVAPRGESTVLPLPDDGHRKALDRLEALVRRCVVDDDHPDPACAHEGLHAGTKHLPAVVGHDDNVDIDHGLPSLPRTGAKVPRRFDRQDHV